MKNLSVMIEKKYKRRITPDRAAQAIVEFAIVLPLLVVLTLGVIEVGRVVFIYAAVTNASREAARFGSAIGFDDDTYYRKYQYCSAIRETAKRTSFLVALQDSDVKIEYDHGPTTTAFDTCPVGVTRDTTIVVKAGQDRVVVTISAEYSPITTLLPLEARIIESSSARTILGYAEVDP